jgi:subtilase family serine protease
VIQFGQRFWAFGTSAATPIFVGIRSIDGALRQLPLICNPQASVIALVNDALTAEGHPTLGFLNPWIYSSAHKLLTDVTIGDSSGGLRYILATTLKENHADGLLV